MQTESFKRMSPRNFLDKSYSNQVESFPVPFVRQSLLLSRVSSPSLLGPRGWSNSWVRHVPRIFHYFFDAFDAHQPKARSRQRRVSYAIAMSRSSLSHSFKIPHYVIEGALLTPNHASDFLPLRSTCDECSSTAVLQLHMEQELLHSQINALKVLAVIPYYTVLCNNSYNAPSRKPWRENDGTEEIKPRSVCQEMVVDDDLLSNTPRQDSSALCGVRNGGWCCRAFTAPWWRRHT